MRSNLSDTGKAATARSSEEKLVLAVCILCSTVAGLFGVFRLFEANYIVAAVDLLGSSAGLYISYYLYTSRNFVGAKAAIAVTAGITCVSAVLIQGKDHVHWIYTFLVFCFFMLRPIFALILCSVVMAILTPTIVSQSEGIQSYVIMANLSMIVVFGYIFAHNADVNKKQLEQISRTDELTNIFNRRAMEVKLNTVIKSHSRNGLPVSLMVLDIDHFKSINDRHGHSAGDEVLKSFSETVTASIRELDSFYRYGGEEFIVIMDNTNLDGAQVVAEKIRAIVEEQVLFQDIQVTISIGLAEYRSQESRDEWIARADRALYKAKQSGRNRVEISEKNSPQPLLDIQA